MMTATAIAVRAVGQRQRNKRGHVYWLLVILAVSLIGVTLDDMRTHHDVPKDSVFARSYMAAKVRNDPAGMWATYSEHARIARGGDRDAYVASMLQGTRPHQVPVNPFHLVGSVPLENSLTLLYYRVDLLATGGRAHVLIPVVTDAAGQVEEGGFDGLAFVAPSGPVSPPFTPTHYPQPGDVGP
jgi:hypothetical protein